MTKYSPILIKKKNQELNPIYCATSQFDLVRLGLVTFLAPTNHFICMITILGNYCYDSFDVDSLRRSIFIYLLGAL